jgi:hypothetical protein
MPLDDADEVGDPDAGGETTARGWGVGSNAEEAESGGQAARQLGQRN